MKRVEKDARSAQMGLSLEDHPRRAPHLRTDECELSHHRWSGESDRGLVDLFFQFKEEQIAGYLFSFNPEPGTATQDLPRQPIHRHRRVQLVKYLIENDDLLRAALSFDETGSLVHLDVSMSMLDEAINSGLPFMTNGCPDRNGVMACNRPYGSYRPGEEYRDYPFLPDADDITTVRQQMRLEEVWAETSFVAW